METPSVVRRIGPPRAVCGEEVNEWAFLESINVDRCSAIVGVPEVSVESRFAF